MSEVNKEIDLIELYQRIIIFVYITPSRNSARANQSVALAREICGLKPQLLPW